MKKLGSVLLALVLLITCIQVAYAWGEAELTLENMLEAFEAGDKERLDGYFEALGIPTEVSQLDPAIAPRWASSETDENKMCHESLTAYGFFIYLGSMQQLYGLTLNAMGYSLEDLQVLIDFVREPDRKLSLGFLQAFSGHFYSPNTGFNFLGEADNTAKTNLEANYRTALGNQQRGDRLQAIKDLACAIHYLQDLNEPHHASNAVAGLTNHDDFEKMASKMLLNEIAQSDTMGELEPDPDFYNGYLSRPVGDSGHQAAIAAFNFSGLARSDNESSQRIAAYFTLFNAMIHTAGILFRFAKNTHRI